MLFLAIPRHQKQKKDNQKIPGVEILWQQLTQKLRNAPAFGMTGFPPFLLWRLDLGSSRKLSAGSLLWNRGVRLWLLRRAGRRFRFPLGLGWHRRFRLLFLYSASAVGAVGLGYVSVIQFSHLPVSRDSPPWFRKPEAILAILAARMAFSSFLTRLRLKYGCSACRSAFCCWSISL